MADLYSSSDALLRDYEKLNQEYQNKAGKYIKNLLKIQRAESGVSAQLFRLERTKILNLKKDPEIHYCSFCGKSEHDVTRLIISSNKICICEECARLCGEILDEAEAANSDHEEKAAEHPQMGKSRQ